MGIFSYMNKLSTRAILIFVALFSLSVCFEFYDNNRSNVINLNHRNWDAQVTQNRPKKVISFVHFYKPDDGKSRNLRTEVNKFAEQTDGMFKVLALNCKDFPEICNKQNVKELPAFKIYPPLPVPVLDYEGEVETKKITLALSGYVENYSQELNINNFEGFLSESHNIPKCILFTDKPKGTPLIIKSLSSQFIGKINHGIVRSNDTGIVSKFRVTKFPTIMVVPVGQKPVFYEGETKYKPIFDFLNVYSETFFKVGEDKTKSSDESKLDKPWLNERLPELTTASSNEVCFKVEGIICVVILHKEKPNEELMNLFTVIQNFLSPKINRGIKYKYSWLNTSTQPNFMNTIGRETNSGPNVMLINPGKRKRFYIMEDDKELNEDNLKNIFEKLTGGELRFKAFKKNTIPELEEVAE